MWAMRTFRGLLYKMLYLNEAKNYTLSRNKSLASEENPTLFFLEIVGFLAMFNRSILYNRLPVTFCWKVSPSGDHYSSVFSHQHRWSELFSVNSKEGRKKESKKWGGNGADYLRWREGRTSRNSHQTLEEAGERGVCGELVIWTV